GGGGRGSPPGARRRRGGWAGPGPARARRAAAPDRPDQGGRLRRARSPRLARQRSRAMTPRPPVLGITMGDPAGVGPEISAKALALPDVTASCRPVVIGDRSVIQATLAMLRSSLALPVVSKPAQCRFEPGSLECLNLGNVNAATLPRAQVSAGAGRAAYDYIDKAVSLCQSGEIDGMVTAPVNKEALAAAGV